MTSRHPHPGQRQLQKGYRSWRSPLILFATHTERNGHVHAFYFGDLDNEGTPAGLYRRVVQPGPII